MGGRRKDRDLHWRGVLQRHSESGLNVASFCRQESLSPPSFYAWRRKLRERDSEAQQANSSAEAAPVSAAQLLPVRIETNGSRAMVRVLLPQGMAIDAPSSMDHTALAGLVRMLREAAEC